MTRTTLVQTLLTAFLITWTAAATAADFSDNALRGVRAVAIAVDGVHPDLARWGFTAADLQATVERHLAGSGVEVVSLEEARAQPDAALLEVAVHINRHTADFLNYFPYHVALKLKQRIALPNDAGAFISATVWSDGQSGIEQPAYLNRLNGYVGALVDGFLAELRSQNRG